MLWIALHLPALALESWAATLGNEARAGRPLALLQDHAVALVDAVAAARGLKPGMKRATALALAPELLWAQADPRRDAQALRAVVHVALAYSPAVAWATPADWRPLRQAPHSDNANDLPPSPAPSPALVGVRLEVQSCLRYFGGLRRLLQRLRDDLAPLGHQVRIASAPTALGAALLAAWRHDLAIGAHSHDMAALQPLLDAVPLHLLGPGQQHWQALQGMGLSTLGDLSGLPRSGLARRFSPELLADIARARGHAPEAQRWLSLAARFDSRIELFTRADSHAQILAGADILLPRLLAWARARQARVAAFELVMHHERRRVQIGTTLPPQRLPPSPGQGEGWDEGRKVPERRPHPHPNPSTSPPACGSDSPGEPQPSGLGHVRSRPPQRGRGPSRLARWGAPR